MDKLRSLREMQPLSDRHKIAQVVQIQFLIPPDLSWRTSYPKPEDFARQLVISIARTMPRRPRKQVIVRYPHPMRPRKSVSAFHRPRKIQSKRARQSAANAQAGEKIGLTRGGIL